MVRSSVASVSNDLHSANHLADGEESEHLSKDNTTGSQLGSIETTEVRDDAGWSGGCS